MKKARYFFSAINAIQKVIYGVRERLWNYPKTMKRLILKTSPFSIIVLFWMILFPIQEAIITTPPKQAIDNILDEAYLGNISKINPIFITNNQLERDLITLVYSPLFRVDKDGQLYYDLATSYIASDDQKTFTFILRQDVYWHDGTKFTADDVIFTFNLISQIKGNNTYYEALKKISVKKVDDYKVQFELPQPNPIFFDIISIGILPKHYWQDIPPSKIEYHTKNLQPIGTGPYYVEKVTDNTVVLKKNERYYKCQPQITQIIFHMYADTQKLITDIELGEIDSILNPNDDIRQVLSMYNKYQELEAYIPRRTKIVFINMRDDITDEYTRQALSLSIDRQKLVSIVSPNGKPAISPINQESWAFNPDVDYYTYDIERAKKLLDENGHKIDEETQKRAITLTLTYLDNSTNQQIADILKELFEQIGITLELKPVDYNTLVQEVVPLRNFELLLFEVESPRDPDCYNLWHSTQIDYPGLNLSGYSYQRVDYLLEWGRETFTRSERKKHYDLFLKYIMNDMPALFLYHPSITYYVDQNIHELTLDNISLPQDRFLSICNAYIE